MPEEESLGETGDQSVLRINRRAGSLQCSPGVWVSTADCLLFIFLEHDETDLGSTTADDRLFPPPESLIYEEDSKPAGAPPC